MCRVIIGYAKNTIIQNGTSESHYILSIYTTHPTEIRFEEIVKNYGYELEQLCMGEDMLKEENWPMNLDYHGPSTCMYKKYGKMTVDHLQTHTQHAKYKWRGIKVG